MEIAEIIAIIEKQQEQINNMTEKINDLENTNKSLLTAINKLSMSVSQIKSNKIK